MTGREQEPRQLRLVNVGDLDNGGDGDEEDVADESWESVMDSIARMMVRLEFRLAPVLDADEEVDELAA